MGVPTGLTDGGERRTRTKIEGGAEFLELRQVNVARGERVVLHDMNLTIRAGEHVAILGPNGCGKSTLILAMTCQIYPIVQPGMQVRIFGRERWDLTELRRHFGVVARRAHGRELAGRAHGRDVGPRRGDCGLLFGVDAVAQSACDRRDARAGLGGAGAHGSAHWRSNWWAPCRPARSGAS
jgi:GTPase SAR1 family protein